MSALKLLPKDGPDPLVANGIYRLGFEVDHSDYTLVLSSPHSKDWQQIEKAFQSLILDFEKKTGRPLKPNSLPQAKNLRSGSSDK